MLHFIDLGCLLGLLEESMHTCHLLTVCGLSTHGARNPYDGVSQRKQALPLTVEFGATDLIAAKENVEAHAYSSKIFSCIWYEAHAGHWQWHSE